MQATTEANARVATPARRGAGRGYLSRFLIVAMLGFSLIGLVAWAVTRSRSVSRQEAVETPRSPTEPSLSRGWAIGVAFALVLTILWNAGLAALVISLLSRIF